MLNEIKNIIEAILFALGRSVEINELSETLEIEKEDIEVLEDMILIATNEAISAAKKEMEEKLGKIGQGLPNIF